LVFGLVVANCRGREERKNYKGGWTTKGKKGEDREAAGDWGNLRVTAVRSELRIS